MSRYIDADKLIDDLEHDIAIDQDHILYVGIDMREKASIQFDKDCKQNCIDMLSKAPTADVRDNVKGEWRSIMVECSRENYDQVFCCSVCGVSNDWRRTNFCPHCGADMRGEQT